MTMFHDPLRLVGRRVVVQTADARLEGAMCSAGLGGVVIDVDGVLRQFAPSTIDSLDAVDATDPELLQD